MWCERCVRKRFSFTFTDSLALFLSDSLTLFLCFSLCFSLFPTLTLTTGLSQCLLEREILLLCELLRKRENTPNTSRTVLGGVHERVKTLSLLGKRPKEAVGKAEELYPFREMRGRGRERRRGRESRGERGRERVVVEDRGVPCDGRPVDGVYECVWCV